MVTMEQDNLTEKQNDYAIFLPAISSFYGTYIGKQRHMEYVPQDRMPAQIPDMEMMNWLNPKKGLFPYKWSLYSAGHANLDMTKVAPKEDMVRNRDPNSFMLADSGGFQIAKGVWPGDWKNPKCPHAEKKRRAVLEWQMQISDYAMTMDIPTWTSTNPEWAKASGIYSYEDAVTATKFNNDYWMANRYGDTKILNVLQGANHADADSWYETMKHYCDPSLHEKPFNGWAMGGQNMCDLHLVLRRLVALVHDGLLESGHQDWMHFLGTSKLEWAVVLTDLQRAIRKYHNPTFTISFDCASPFLATANGQLYYNISTEDRKKWSYQMESTADNKAWAKDSRSYRDAVLQEKVHSKFEDSPISSRMSVSDVCYYGPGDLNKIGKEGKTSWDSFSYALLMGHNVWMHLEAVQRANRIVDQGGGPSMLLHPLDSGLNTRTLIDQIFAQHDRKKSLQMIDDYASIWERVIGTRGYTGKKATNATSMFNNLFETDDAEFDEVEFDESLLDKLEESV
jgi:queuine/archaeosine tRNA-ribosyltransferase